MLFDGLVFFEAHDLLGASVMLLDWKNESNVALVGSAVFMGMMRVWSWTCDESFIHSMSKQNGVGEIRASPRITSPKAFMAREAQKLILAEDRGLIVLRLFV